MRPGTVTHARAWRGRTGADCADVDAYAAAYAQACLAERAETADDGPNLDRCLGCSTGVLDGRLGGMCGDCDERRLRNCWTCRWDEVDMLGVHECAQNVPGMTEWVRRYCYEQDDYMPPKDAPPCPGWEAKP